MTEQNARGVAAVLAFAGYGVIPKKDYSYYNAKAKRFYEFRSKALHRGHWHHVGDRHLDEFSQWISWLII